MVKVWKRDPSTQNEYVVDTFLNGMDDLRAGADEGEAARVGGQLHRALHRHGVRGVEDCGTGKRLEHGQVLQGHLAWPVLADGDPAVASHHVEVGLADDAHPEVVEGPGEEAG